jgi:hypothetical protein
LTLTKDLSSAPPRPHRRGGYEVVAGTERQCTATAKSTGKRCARAALDGTNVCFYHGAEAPQVKQAAIKRVSERKALQKAERWLARQGYEQIDDPLGELVNLASEATAYRELFRAQVDRLMEADEVRYEHRAGEQLRAEMALWERAADRCLKVYSEIVRLGIAERQVRIREAEIVLMAQAIRNILGRLELSPKQKTIAGQVVAEELRAIEAPKG